MTDRQPPGDSREGRPGPRQQATPPQLTPCQQAVYDLLVAHMAEHAGVPPTMRELAALYGSNQACIHTHLRALARKGVVELTPSGSRNIRLAGEHRWGPFARALSDEDAAALGRALRARALRARKGGAG